MGVKGLETYIKTTIPEVLVPINIVELVKNETQRVNYRPIIIVDFKGCIPHFYHEPSLIYGGRLKELSSRIELFINKITSAGGQVVAFYDGFHPNEKRDEYIYSRKQRLQIIEEKFDAYECNENYVESFPLVIEAEDITAHCILRTLQYCQFKCSTKEVDLEIMEYMKTNDCLAVITRATDMLMFPLECDTIYISPHFLDVDSMTSKMFHQETLRKYFNLRQTQMPLFGTLAGNDILPKFWFKRFHREILRSGDVFTGIADYIRNLPDDETIYNYLNRISDETSVSKTHLKNCLQFYRCEHNNSEPPSDISEWNQIMLLAREKLEKGELPPGLYDLLVKCNHLPPLVAEDPKTARIDLFLQPLRRRVYDLLFLHYPLFEGVIEDHITKDDIFSFRPTPRPLDYPAVSLLDLWTNENNRWETFCNCIDTSVDVNFVNRIEKHLIIPSLALYYINKNASDMTLFNKDEILSLIATIVQTDESNLILPEDYHINRRVADIFAKFQQVCVTMHFINGVCGAPIPLKYCSPAKYSDGDLFCYVFGKPMEEIMSSFSQKQGENYQQILKLINI